MGDCTFEEADALGGPKCTLKEREVVGDLVAYVEQRRDLEAKFHARAPTERIGSKENAEPREHITNVHAAEAGEAQRVAAADSAGLRTRLQEADAGAEISRVAQG